MVELGIALVAGLFYGLAIGIIPAAGATTGLVALYGVIPYFLDYPMAGVVFLMAVVAASTTADSFTSILLGIPGSNSSAATIVDGFPLARKGQASYAISAAITTSTVNGLIWGILVFLFLPYYGQVLLSLGVPELWAFTVLSLLTVGFVSTSNRVRSLFAIAAGLIVGAIGVDPNTNAERFTLGWMYLEDGIQLMPVVAGLFAIPELISGFKLTPAGRVNAKENQQQVLQGIKDSWRYRWDSLRGGAIGAVVGLLPGLGGAISDWISYASTVAAHPTEKFGNGNIKGVIGPEGSNNAQKATSMITTVLFAIPGAPFAAVLLGLFMYLNFEMGSPDLLNNIEFFRSMALGFLVATVLVAILSYLFIPTISRISQVPYQYYFPILIVLIVWSCLQYTGGWEDIVMLLIFSVLGIAMKHFQFSRPAFLIAFILSERVENMTIQITSLYSVADLLVRPVFLALIGIFIGLLFLNYKLKLKIDYS